MKEILASDITLKSQLRKAYYSLEDISNYVMLYGYDDLLNRVNHLDADTQTFLDGIIKYSDNILKEKKAW